MQKIKKMKRVGWRLSQEQRAYLKSLYVAGHRQVDIAAALGICQSAVAMSLKRDGVKTPARGWPKGRTRTPRAVSPRRA